MTSLVHYSEYTSLPARLKMNVSQLETLSNIIQCTEVADIDRLELKAAREIMRKLYLRIQKRLLTGVSTHITFSDSELWALSHITQRIPSNTYASLALYPIIDLIYKRKL